MEKQTAAQQEEAASGAEQGKATASMTSTAARREDAKASGGQTSHCLYSVEIALNAEDRPPGDQALTKIILRAEKPWKNKEKSASGNPLLLVLF